MKRILVCGSRLWKDLEPIRLVLSQHNPADTVVIHGAARGADRIAGMLASIQGFRVESYPADWDRYGRAAGMIRNRQMLDTGIDTVYAFPIGESRGTWGCINEARRRGIEVVVYRGEPVLTNDHF